MDRIKTLLSISGRTSRLGYWRNYLLCAVLLTIAGGLAVMGSVYAGWWGAPLFLLLVPPLWMNLAAMIRRLHDRGKAGWWYLIFFAPTYVALFLLELSDETRGATQLAGALLALPGFVLSAWGAIEIYLLGSKRTDNRYGPVPARGG